MTEEESICQPPTGSDSPPKTEEGQMSSTMLLKKNLLAAISILFPTWIFVKFFLFAIIPPFADNIIPLFFTGNIPNESGLAVSSQFIFISIILEVIQEGVGNSLFHYVGKNYKSNRQLSLVAFKLSLVVLICGGVLLTVVMLLFTPQFVNLINTPGSIAEETRRYLYVSSFSFVPILLNTAATNYLMISTSFWLVVSQTTSVVLAFFFNFFVFGQHGWSLKWGVGELGYYKIIQSSVTLVVNFSFLFILEKLSPMKFLTQVAFFTGFKRNFKAFFKISWGNFGDSAVRNFFYFVVTLQFMNYLGEDEAGAWNLLNGIVWGTLLIPGFVVANYAKVCIGTSNNSHVRIKRVARESCICLTAWVIIVACLAGFLWPTIAAFFSKENKNIQELSEKMLHDMGWIFIVFAYNNAMDSFFFGTGKTEYVFYQSLLTNVIVYLTPWILYLCNVITPTYWWVIGLYISGMMVDFCLTLFFCVRVWKSMQSIPISQSTDTIASSFSYQNCDTYN